MDRELADAQLDTIEESSNIKIDDREAFLDAIEALVKTCSSTEDCDEEEDDDEPKKPQGKGPSISVILGALGKPKKGE